MDDAWAPDPVLVNQPVGRADFYLIVSKLLQINSQLLSALVKVAPSDPSLAEPLSEIKHLQRAVGESIDALVTKREI